jgi:hypothetical protein
LIKKKKVLFLGFSMIILLITIMVFTTPTKKEIQLWTLNENEIVCQKVDWGLKCMKDDREIRFSSSHFKNVAIFATYEVDYEYENGEQVTYRTLGILEKVFSKEDGLLWEKILN